MTLGERIREARLSKDMTQDDLAHAVRRVSNGDVSPAATEISRYERGRHKPRADTLAAIAKATDRDISYFLNGASTIEEAALVGGGFRGGSGADVRSADGGARRARPGAKGGLAA